MFIGIQGKLGWDIWVCGPAHVSSLGQSTAEAPGAGWEQQVLPGQYRCTCLWRRGGMR